MPEKMIDRYGRVTIARMIAAFYSDMLQSAQLGHYFHDVSVSGLVQHQAMFMETTMGGPTVFLDEQIRQAHHHLRISEDDFDEMLQLLADRMRQSGVEAEDIEEVLTGYRRLQNDVVNPPEELEPVGK